MLARIAAHIVADTSGPCEDGLHMLWKAAHVNE